jgi:hypothetical protein
LLFFDLFAKDGRQYQLCAKSEVFGSSELTRVAKLSVGDVVRASGSRDEKSDWHSNEVVTLDNVEVLESWAGLHSCPFVLRDRGDLPTGTNSELLVVQCDAEYAERLLECVSTQPFLSSTPPWLASPLLGQKNRIILIACRGSEQRRRAIVFLQTSEVILLELNRPVRRVYAVCARALTLKEAMCKAHAAIEEARAGGGGATGRLPIRLQAFPRYLEKPAIEHLRINGASMELKTQGYEQLLSLCFISGLLWVGLEAAPVFEEASGTILPLTSGTILPLTSGTIGTAITGTITGTKGSTITGTKGSTGRRHKGSKKKGSRDRQKGSGGIGWAPVLTAAVVSMGGLAGGGEGSKGKEIEGSKGRDGGESKGQKPKAAQGREAKAAQGREAKVAALVARRQGGLTVVMEHVFDEHNAAAVIRSCDAFGVSEVIIIPYPITYCNHPPSLAEVCYHLLQPLPPLPSFLCLFCSLPPSRLF